MRLWRIGWLSILFLLATGAQLRAESWDKILDLELFGHRLQIKEDQTLAIDNKERHRNAYVSIKSVAVVDGVPVAIGLSSSGGNSCSSTPFVISFPQGETPRFDGPIASCYPVKTEIMPQKVTFSTKPLPSANGEVWEWTAGQGIRKTGEVKFTASLAKGWDELRQRDIGHPSQLFEYGEISARLDTLLGADKERFAQIIIGAGSGEFKNDTYVAKVCAPHMCGVIEAIVIADIPSKQVYLAWKDGDKPIVVRPEVVKWGKKFRAELREWTARWK